MERARAVARHERGETSAALDLLASLSVRLADPFSDKTTIVGALSAAQDGFARGGASRADPSTPARPVHEAAKAFAVTLSKTSVASSAPSGLTTLPKAEGSYAAGAGHVSAA